VRTRSSDGTEIHYEVTGDAETALVFVSGWMGNTRWWDAQRDAFAATHRVVTLDLAGHGASGLDRTTYTAQAYADDIIAVVRAVGAPRVILVGHSMSGAYVTLAAPHLPSVVEVVLVDTLKNLDAVPTIEQVAPMLAAYRADYPAAVRGLGAKFLFAPGTPPEVRARLEAEFLAVTGDEAATRLEPLYRCDIRAAAQAVTVPVRGIDTDLHPHSVESNRTYFADYEHVTIPGFGHYPMLEAPDQFNIALRGVLT
jgi:pimeloyl-ACP methyl ester carboxylesterase